MDSKTEPRPAFLSIHTQTMFKTLRSSSISTHAIKSLPPLPVTSMRDARAGWYNPYLRKSAIKDEKHREMSHFVESLLNDLGVSVVKSRPHEN
jgi:hypothetical protein